MESSSSGPSILEDNQKPCVVTFVTQNDRLNEPPPQPRVRKVTTVINTLAVVIRDTPTELGVWVMTACVHKSIPKTHPHLFVDFRLGTWMIVGIYPDGTVASFSPWPLVLNAYQTFVGNGVVSVAKSTLDLKYETTVTLGEYLKNHGTVNPNDYSVYDQGKCVDYWLIPGFGRVLAHCSFQVNHQTIRERNQHRNIWLSWCGEGTQQCCWAMHSIDNEQPEMFSEQDLRDCLEFIRNREIATDYPPATSRVVARHFGLITEICESKKILFCWSPKASIESDHTVWIPQPPKQREIESPPLVPLIGQWLQFDLQSKDVEKYMTSKFGSKLLIQEYLPITSPAGVGVTHTNNVVRVVLSCILVKGTDHPLLFELPYYGIVIAQKNTLVSGAHMQLVLEKMSTQIVKISGVCWKVISSIAVNPKDVKVEKMQELLVHYIPLRDSMETSVLVQGEIKTQTLTSLKHSAQNSSTSSNMTTARTGPLVTTLKYQQPHHQYFQEAREYFHPRTIRMSANDVLPMYDRPWQAKRKLQQEFSGATLEAHALVEKTHSQKLSGILWIFENAASLFFYHSEDVSLNIGEYYSVKLVQVIDPQSKNGFRWTWMSGTRKPAPFQHHVDRGCLIIQETLNFIGVDKHKRVTFRGMYFPNVLDVHSVIQNPACNLLYHVTITRMKVHCLPYNENGSFHWVVSSTLFLQAAPLQQKHRHHQHLYQAYPSRPLTLQSVATLADAARSSSERSSTSSPLQKHIVLNE
ncbi:unnamed protein product [Caenorhabditis sp. 36 PRJEB53466]|nr:unnamed protein product [Caenorhabditis sp. 36 PRJEB53466]